MKDPKRENCQNAIEALLGQMENESFQEQELEIFCQQYPDCSESLRATYATWQSLEELEVPKSSPVMDAGFYKMLNEFQTEQNKRNQSIFGFISKIFEGPGLKWAVLAGMFLLGMVSGSIFWSGQSGETMAVVEEESLNKVNLSYAKLTSTESVTDRLQGIQMVKEMVELDNRIIEALNRALLNDENENVRLSAIETMLHFTDNPKVRENLIRAIPYQDSPLIQMTLAEVVIALEEKSAIVEIRELLENQALELEVKMKMEETIELLL